MVAKSSLGSPSAHPLPPQRPVTFPNGAVIKPSAVVRWLGVFFDRKPSSKAHVDKEIVSLSKALQMTIRLETGEWGLSSQHLRQLTVFSPSLALGQKGYIGKLQKLQDTVCRRILGAF